MKGLKMRDDMNYEVRNVKFFKGHDGIGYNASLYLEGKKIGAVSDYADGAPLVLILNQEERKKLYKYCEPMDGSDGLPISGGVNAELFIENLVNEYDVKQRAKRKCKNNTVFFFASDEELQFRVVKCPFSTEVKKEIANRYPNEIVIFYNEIINKK
jgi:hypothetical protein